MKNILHRFHTNAWYHYQHKQLSRQNLTCTVKYSEILYIKGGDSLDIDDRHSNMVSMRWMWMNDEMSPLKPWGEWTQQRELQAWRLLGWTNCSKEVFLKISTAYLTFQDKGDTCFQDTSPRKPCGCCRSQFIVIWRGAAGRIIDAPITLHNSVEWRRRVRNNLNLLPSPPALIKSVWWGNLWW